MKILVLSIFICFTYSSYGQVDKTLSTLSYDKAVMYNFKNGEGLDSMYIVDANGELSKSIINQIELSPLETKDFNAKIESKKSYGEATLDCFDAHLGFVYFFENKIVAHITISTNCRRLYSSIEIVAQKQGKVYIGTDIYYTKTGLSDSFINFIKLMEIKYHFSHS